MLKSINLKQVLFIDIETVSQEKSFENLDQRAQQFWEKKSAYFRNEEESAGDVYQRAGIYAEFGKIVCISVGIIYGSENSYQLKIKSFASEDEKTLLSEFIELVTKMEEKSPVIFCAHNGKEFDYPYISRRLLINGFSLPYSLDNAGKKPWEIKHLDTLELWKFGDYKHYTSLDLLTHIFSIPSPKEEIDGSQVGDVFYNEKDLNKIVRYCENDVIALTQLLLRYTNRSLIAMENIERTLF